MFERPKSGERAVLVHCQLKHEGPADLREFKELASAAGALPITLITTVRERPDPKSYIGSGKLQEILTLVQGENIELILFNHDLSPSQERNIEKFLKCRVLSRTGLILDIFAQRARTFEGQLQVELAQLKHISTRLIRGWTHLERQKGGIGLRGPGETQLETDRRLIKQRIKHIEEKLEKVRLQRQQSRKKRQKVELNTAALVGYTNAGKSTIFNALTGAEVLVANKLFATLDPTLRTLQLPIVGKIVLADTVGFVRDLPHNLVDAFRATLEETRDANLLLHVVDRHDPRYSDTMREVNKVLIEIEADQIPQLVVFNKVDLLEDTTNKLGTVDKDTLGNPVSVWVSALTGAGLKELQEAIQQRLTADLVYGSLHLTADCALIRARLYELKVVREDVATDDGWILKIHMPKRQWQTLCHQAPFLEDRLEVE